MKKILLSLMIVTMAPMGCAALESVGVPPVPVAASQTSETVVQTAPAPEVVPTAAPVQEAVVPTTPGSEIGSPAVPSIPALGEKPPELALGAKYVYKRTNCVTGDSQVSVSTVKSKINWLGTIPAYVIELGKKEGAEYLITSYLILNNDLNTLAILDKEGKLLQQAVKSTAPATTDPPLQATSAESDCVKIFEWPLTLGKNFTANYAIISKPDNKTYPKNDQISVGAELVPIKLTLGEWKTYRIRRVTVGSVEEHYFAPEIGIEVKLGISQTLDNLAGPGVFISELIGYDIPGVGKAGAEF